MGSGKSKAVVVESTARSVLSKRAAPSEATKPPTDELTLASGRAQLDPEVLKEISKWSTVKTTVGSYTKQKAPAPSSSASSSSTSSTSNPSLNQTQLSHSSQSAIAPKQQQQPRIPSPKFASIIRFQEIEKFEKEWNDKQQIEGRLTENQLKSIMTLLRNNEEIERTRNNNTTTSSRSSSSTVTTEDNSMDIATKLSIDFKMPLNEIILLQRNVKMPKVMVDRDDEHLLIAN